MDVLPHQLSQSNPLFPPRPEEIIPITTEKPSSDPMAATSSKQTSSTESRYPITEDPKFMCKAPGCNFTTKYDLNLKRHAQLHNERQKGPSQTTIPTTLTSTGPRSVSTTPSIKNFKCNHNECSYSTAYERNLKRHLETHSVYCQFYPFGCPRCDYRSRYKEKVRAQWKREHSGVAAMISDQDKMSKVMNDHNKILKTKNDQQTNCQLDGDDVEPTAVVDKEVDQELSLVNAKKSNEVLLDLLEQSDSTELFACMLCDFVGYSEKAAWDHAKCHNKQPIRPNDQLTESPVIC